MFSSQFLATDAAEIARAVEDNGLFVMHGALDDAFIERILSDVGDHRFEVNRNWVTGVYFDRQFYLTHMLACSRSFADLVTAPKVFEICDAILGPAYRLKAMRYYETYGKHRMQWHTDNKTARGKAPIPGLIFIAYVADVDDGEFQYVVGSHKWSGDEAYSDYSDEYIASLPAGDVVSVRAPKGAVIIYNTYGIHRAKPVEHTGFVRQSLFFQVDSQMESGEPLLLNPAYVRISDPRTLAYLGFDLPTESTVFPVSRLSTLPLGRLGGQAMGRWLAHRVARFAYDSSPAAVRRLVKRLVAPRAVNR